MNKRSKQVRRDTIKLMYEHHMGHYGGSLSCIEILIALYDHIMTKDDVFILSKGHACAPMYVLLREKGLNPKIEHHPSYDPANGIHMTSGSLGYGLPYAIGVALGKKIRGENGRVYVLLGDGEVQEGTFWESEQILTGLRLDNLTVIIDYNHLQGSSWLMHAGWTHFSYKYAYGHNMREVISALKSPLVVLETIKGKGVPFMYSRVEWHSKILTEELYNKAMEGLQ